MDRAGSVVEVVPIDLIYDITAAVHVSEAIWIDSAALTKEGY